MVMGRISLVIGRFYVFSDFCAREKVTTTEFRDRARILAFRWSRYTIKVLESGQEKPVHLVERVASGMLNFLFVVV